ncbi:MAG: biotin transporter BioY [Micrococcales bacterium]|nr:biotin transporter BioY [Micrococcales bacterium]
MEDLTKARAIAEIALLAAIIVALGLMPPLYVLGLTVPITAQTLGVMLAGAVLGARRGTAAVAVVVLLVVASLPVLSGGRGGVGVILGPTGGYLLGWLPGALVTGLLARRALRLPTKARAFGLVGACLVGGVVVVYALGIPWTAVVTGLDLSTTAVGAAVFLPGDLLKAVLAGLAAAAVHRQVRIDHMRPDRELARAR